MFFARIVQFETGKNTLQPIVITHLITACWHHNCDTSWKFSS